MCSRVQCEKLVRSYDRHDGQISCSTCITIPVGRQSRVKWINRCEYDSWPGSPRPLSFPCKCNSTSPHQSLCSTQVATVFCILPASYERQMEQPSIDPTIRIEWELRPRCGSAGSCGRSLQVGIITLLQTRQPCRTPETHSDTPARSSTAHHEPNIRHAQRAVASKIWEEVGDSICGSVKVQDRLQVYLRGNNSFLRYLRLFFCSSATSRVHSSRNR